MKNNLPICYKDYDEMLDLFRRCHIKCKRFYHCKRETKQKELAKLSLTEGD